MSDERFIGRAEPDFDTYSEHEPEKRRQISPLARNARRTRVSRSSAQPEDQRRAVDIQ